MSGASGAEIFWWVGLPYLALGIFVVGHIWRWRYDQFGWTSRSTQLQERRLLKWGSPVFHYGTFAAIAGHVIGVLVPEAWTHAIGIPQNAYRWFSAAAGTLAAVLVIGGVVILAGRRLLVPTEKSPMDADRQLLAEHLADAGTVPGVCAAADRLHVRFAITGGRPWAKLTNHQWEQYPGFDGVADSPAFREVSTQGPYTLYELTGCPR